MLNDLISSGKGGEIFFRGLSPPGPGMATALHKATKLSDNRKSYNKQLLNLVEVIPFYGIGRSRKLDGFSAHKVFSFVLVQLLRKRRKRKLEAVKFRRKRKRFYKISWKRKRTRKRPTLYGAGSGSKKSQELGGGRELGSMTLQEELEAEAKNILLLSHP